MHILNYNPFQDTDPSVFYLVLLMVCTCSCFVIPFLSPKCPLLESEKAFCNLISVKTQTRTLSNDISQEEWYSLSALARTAHDLLQPKRKVTDGTSFP